MNSISVKAYAKINLGLDVLRKRPDGYHDVCMIMQSLDVYDTIMIEKTNSNKIMMKTNLSYLPIDKGNLVYKAASLFFEKTGITDGLFIKLDKHIPVAAGLAGGSSDAAATLKGLNILYNTGLTTEELMTIGVKIGADVPYCIKLGTALSEGIGEVLTSLRSIPECHVVLVKPDISVSTKYVYENLKLTDDIPHPDITNMRIALENGDLTSLTNNMDNILQTVTVKNYPIINEIKNKMNELGSMVSLMSGSGPTVFGIYKTREHAQNAYQYFLKHKHYGKQVFLTKPYSPSI